MSNIVKIENIENKLINIKNQPVLVANDVAKLYGVEVKALNQAVNRNKDLFPEHYRFQLSKEEKQEVVTQCDHLQNLKYSPQNPYVFTEQGLYMVATILQSERAKEVHFYIVETFSKIRLISKNLKEMVRTKNQQSQNSLLKSSNELLNDVIEADIIEEKKLDSNVKKVKDEFEINLGVIRFKRTIENKDENQ